jgi:hypothetical protein
VIAAWRQLRRSKCMPVQMARFDVDGKRIGLVYWDADTKPSGWRWAAGRLRSRDQWVDVHACCAACDAVLDAPTKGKP